jgi:hypothetical protein
METSKVLIALTALAQNTRRDVHIGVDHVDKCIRLSSSRFGAEPTVRKSDQAKRSRAPDRLSACTESPNGC